MSGASLDRQFAGQARLLRLLLWRIGDSTDIDACLSVACEKGMIDDADEEFARLCLDAEERQREGEALGLDVDDAFMARLRRLADKLNRADSA